MMKKSSRPKLSEAQLIQLFEEVDGVCPKCGRRIFDGAFKGRGLRLAEIAHIYPHSPSDAEIEMLKEMPRAENVEGLENLIPLCRDCHKMQDSYTKVEDYLELYTLKRNKEIQWKAKEDIANQDLDSNVKIVLKKFLDLKPDNLIGLSYHPLAVDQKICEPMLCDDVKHKVTDYHGRIRFALQELDAEGPGSSDVIASEIKASYKKLAKRYGYQRLLFESDHWQEDIFNALVSWIQSKTGASRKVSEILVSFFVQNCEVFDEIAK